ncbi:class I SAM-dependent methyltransferase [Halomicrobium salinisoli]|uniref:class I SAM-dependent methyltransferase n=1 Tax=Halomicrobium salinisoli TaxID=2878391 RepID=UPI001CF009ED|nr:class I SAM-dependent methyltransferase [Halomicrobium salinisoli]
MDAPENRDLWAERRGAYSPDYYAHHGPNDVSEAVGDVLDDAVSREAPVLELGCSSGRHLAHLRERGFEDLHGIDVNGEAFDVMAEAYPDLAEAGTFVEGAFDDVLPDLPDDHFAAVYSVETLQHVHPDAAWAFDEIARVTDECLITVENEDGEGGSARDDEEAETQQGDDPPVNYVAGEVPLYYRNWRDVFEGTGFEQVSEAETKRDTMRVFGPADD